MKTINQRELRNDSAEVMRGVEQGETYVVTRRGVPIAQLAPIREDADLRLVRPARQRPKYSAMTRAQMEADSSDVLSDLRGDR